MDESIDEINNDDCRKSITKLRQVTNTVKTFTDPDECIRFINGIKEEKAFMISSGALGQTTIPFIHDQPQVSTIYIFCGNKRRHEEWTKQWSKVKDVYTDIAPICEALKQADQDCDENMVSISLVKTTDGSSNQNLNELDSSFMYTQILKEILLTIDFEKEHITEFLTYCRDQFAGNNAELKNVDKIEKEYHEHQPIWWYTYQCFLYSMLNKALRMMEVDIIIKMGSFVRDLHQHIAALHLEQYGGHHHSSPFILYRGQGLSQTHFDELMKTQGGLLSFNNFLSTSKDPNVSIIFACRIIETSNLVGILFIMKIDPSIPSTPFANIGDVTYYEEEEEILFSMHFVFRIGRIKQLEGNNCLWQVDLTLTGNNDPQLSVLTGRMHEETKGSAEWFRLGKLMIKLAQHTEAEDLYEKLLLQTTDEREKGDIFYQLGWIKGDQGKYTEALILFENSVKIREQILTLEHSDVGECYNNIGLMYDCMGEYSKALLSHEKALEIYQKTLLPNHPLLATSYNNIDLVYQNMGEYSKALSYHEKVFGIQQKTLPPNHPELASAYNNIGSVYDNMGEYSKALSSHEKALDIRQKTLSPNYPDLATSYNNIGLVYNNIGEYSKALSYLERALDILQSSLPPNHPTIKTVQKKYRIYKKEIVKSTI
jgi:tetratricopeptide (TPR) repeat protein